MVNVRCISMDAYGLVVHMHDDMPKAMIMKFDLALQRMLLGEPIQYIVALPHFMVERLM